MRFIRRSNTLAEHYHNSGYKMLDDRQIEEQYCGMKWLGVAFIALLLASGLETSAQDKPFSSGGQGLGVMPGQNLTPCPDYKIVIITPPKDVDFKMQVSTPAKNMDSGIIFKPCSESNQVAFGPRIIMPNQKQAIIPDQTQIIMSNQEMSDYLKRILSLSGRRK